MRTLCLLCSSVVAALHSTAHSLLIIPNCSSPAYHLPLVTILHKTRFHLYTCQPHALLYHAQPSNSCLRPSSPLELFTTEQHPLHPHQFFPPSLLSLVPSLPFCSALTSYAHRPSLNQCTTQQMDHSGVDRESGWTLCRLPLCSLSLPLLSLQMTHPHQPFADSFEERKQRECPSRLSRFSLLFFGESVCRNQ
jgi:hypothetical protein